MLVFLALSDVYCLVWSIFGLVNKDYR